MPFGQNKCHLSINVIKHANIPKERKHHQIMFLKEHPFTPHFTADHQRYTYMQGKSTHRHLSNKGIGYHLANER